MSGERIDKEGGDALLLETRACAAVSWACSGSSGCVWAMRSLRRRR